MILLVFIIIFGTGLLCLVPYVKKVEIMERESCYVRPIMTECDLEVMRGRLKKQKRF